MHLHVKIKKPMKRRLSGPARGHPQAMHSNTLHGFVMATFFQKTSSQLLCGTAIVLTSASALWAQSENVLSLDPVLLQQQDEYGEAADRAASVYVADAELERARMGDLKDLFAGIASVSVGGAIPVAQKIFVNGVDMLNLAITVDGVSQNNRAFHHVSANAFDPGLMKFVRVDPGVAGADAGPNAVVGAVVMETVDAVDVLEDGKNFGGNLRLSLTDNGENFGRALTLAGRTGGFEWLTYYKSITGENFNDGNGAEVLGSAANLQAGLLKLAYESEDGHRLEFTGQTLKDDDLRPYRANIGAVIGGRPVPDTRVYDTERNSYALSYENTQAEGLFDPKVVLGFSESIINVPTPFGSEGATQTFTFKAQNTFNLSADNTIVAGVDYYDREGSYFDPTEGYLEENSQNLGVFVQGRFSPTNRLKLSTGLRADWQDFEGVESAREFSEAGLSGNLSVIYDVTDQLALRAGYSNVFGGVAIEDNYTFWRRWDYIGLEPARSENYIVGFDWTGSALTLGGEAFVTQINDGRVGGANIDFESRGFNLYGTYDWGLGFARLTYSNAEVEVDGGITNSYDVQDFGAPIGQVIALEVQQELPAYDLLVGGSLDIALDYDGTETSGDQGLDGYTVVNVFAEYNPSSMSNLTIRAEVSNLFDETYADRATYGADFTSIRALNEPGRTFSLVAVTRF